MARPQPQPTKSKRHKASDDQQTGNATSWRVHGTDKKHDRHITQVSSAMQIIVV